EGKQSLNQKGSLHKVAAIVIRAERYHIACRAVYPVRPRAMEAVCSLQEVEDAVHTFKALRPRDKAAFDAHDKRHDAEAGATARYQVSGGVAFACHAAGRFCEIPEVFEGLLLHFGE